MLLAMNVEDMVLALGHEVAGIAGRLGPALALAGEGDFDLAILDVNLAGEESFAVADALRTRRIPYLFATGYGVEAIREDHRAAPVLHKPFRSSELAEALARAA